MSDDEDIDIKEKYIEDAKEEQWSLSNKVVFCPVDKASIKELRAYLNTIKICDVINKSKEIAAFSTENSIAYKFDVGTKGEISSSLIQIFPLNLFKSVEYLNYVEKILSFITNQIETDQFPYFPYIVGIGRCANNKFPVKKIPEEYYEDFKRHHYYNKLVEGDLWQKGYQNKNSKYLEDILKKNKITIENYFEIDIVYIITEMPFITFETWLREASDEEITKYLNRFINQILNGMQFLNDNGLFYDKFDISYTALLRRNNLKGDNVCTTAVLMNFHDFAQISNNIDYSQNPKQFIKDISDVLVKRKYSSCYINQLDLMLGMTDKMILKFNAPYKNYASIMADVFF